MIIHFQAYKYACFPCAANQGPLGLLRAVLIQSLSAVLQGSLLLEALMLCQVHLVQHASLSTLGISVVQPQLCLKPKSQLCI